MDSRPVHALPHIENVAYIMPAVADATTQLKFEEIADKKRWRINEARDFIVIMREVLRRSSAQYVAIAQDDGVWREKPKILSTPVQSFLPFPQG